jgi:V/A-type H+-transporting ATPase subunit C
MLTRSDFLNIANAPGFEEAADVLASTEYSLGPSRDFLELENILLQRRTEVRNLFKELILDERIVELFRAREDFANVRLALRRKLTDRPIGTNYSNQGSVPAELFEQVFEQEDYSPLPLYLRQAIEDAVLAYYPAKDIRQIDHAIDRFHILYGIETSKNVNNIFLLEWFRMQADMANIRTMLRLKFTESDQRDVFLEGGYIGIEMLKHGLGIGYESIVPLFMPMPYYEVVELGVNYLMSNNSFLKLEHCCDEHLMGFLKSASQITAGSQPVIAYFLKKENEIRQVRLMLTAKKNSLDTKLILDSIS